jgi:hypothetical protein
MAAIKLFGEDEIFDKNSKVILGSLVAFLLILYACLSYSGYFENKRRNQILAESFNGKVISVKVDYKNHGDTTVKLSDSTSLMWYFPKQDFEVLVGDRLVKQKKTIYMYVYRNGLRKIRIDMLNI